MVKVIFLIFCVISAFGGSSTSTNIRCNYVDNIGFTVVGFIYQCYNFKINSNILTEESAEITEISGTHWGSRTNDDVLGIFAYEKIIQVFPKGLEKFFKNLKVIQFDTCQLKEIHQSDLKVFPNLVYFGLRDNEIEVIEEGLFDFNPNLELVGFMESKIIHIDPNVFDNLKKFSVFSFTHVPCVSQSVDHSTEVQEIIKVVKSKCSNSEFLSLENQIRNLEIESKILNCEAFGSKLENLEKSFNNSKFSRYRPLNYNFQNLKLNVSCRDDVDLATV